MSIDLNDPTVDEKLRRAFVEGWCESSPAGYDSLRAILADAESPHEEQRLPPAALREVIACGISDEGVQELFRDLLVSPQRNGIAAWLRVALHGDDADACAGAASICLLSAELRGEFLVDLAAATNSPSWAARREVLEVLAADQSGDERIKSLVDHALAVQPPDVAIAVASQRYRDGDRRPAIVELIVRGLRSPDPDVCGCGCFAIAQHADPIIPVAELFEIMRRPDLHVAQPMFVLHHLQARRDPEATRLAVLDLESDRYE
ncbi:MAG TPA: hypothetical protein VGE52_01740, partial [Pirellulales bacterium]